MLAHMSPLESLETIRASDRLNAAFTQPFIRAPWEPARREECVLRGMAECYALFAWRATH